MSHQKSVLVAVLAIALVGLGFRLEVARHALPMDDALITLRYAKNLIDGHGLVYNVGEAVMGSTAPLYAVMLAVPLALTRDPLLTLDALPLVFDLLTLGLLLWTPLLAAKPINRLPYAAAFASAWFAAAAVGYGMETQAFVLFLFLARILIGSERPLAAGLILGSAGLLRPEAAIAALVFSARLRGSSTWVRAVVGVVLPLAAWILVATIVYGDPVPHSVHAKSTLGHSTFDDWLGFFVLRNPVLALLWVLAVGALVDRSTPAFVRDFVALSFGLGAFYLITRPVFFGVWYFPPVGFGLLLGATAFGAALLRRATASIPRFGAEQIAIVITVGWLALGTITLGRVRANALGFAPNVTEVYLPLAERIAEDDRDDVTAIASDIGYVGYFCDCTIIDAGALVSPQVLAVYRSEDAETKNIVDVFEPDWYASPVNNGVHATFSLSSASSAYEAVARFQKYGDNTLPIIEDPSAEYRRTPEYVGDFVLYRRIED